MEKPQSHTLTDMYMYSVYSGRSEQKCTILEQKETANERICNIISITTELDAAYDSFSASFFPLNCFCTRLHTDTGQQNTKHTNVYVRSDESLSLQSNDMWMHKTADRAEETCLFFVLFCFVLLLSDIYNTNIHYYYMRVCYIHVTVCMSISLSICTLCVILL